MDRYLSKLPLKGFPYEEAVIFCDALRRLVGWKEIDYTLEQYIKKQVQERYFEAGEKEDDFTPYPPCTVWPELRPEDVDENLLRFTCYVAVCYYDEFQLVRTNFKEDFVFELPIEGSGAFSVAPSGDTFLFEGGYQKHGKFYFLTARGGRLGQKQKAVPTCDGKKVSVERCSLLRSQMLFLGKNGVLYGGVLGESEA